MAVIERIPLQRSVAVVTAETITVRPTVAQLVAPAIQAAFAGGAVALIVGLFDRLPLWLLAVALMVALLFGPIAVIGGVYYLFGSAFLVERVKGTARWQQGFLGLGVGTRELVPFDRIDHIAVRGDLDQELSSGQRQDVVQWEVLLVKDNGREIDIGTIVVARAFALQGLERANRLAQRIGEMTGHEARTQAMPPEIDQVVAVRERRRSVSRRRRAAPPPRGET